MSVVAPSNRDFIDGLLEMSNSRPFAILLLSWVDRRNTEVEAGETSLNGVAFTGTIESMVGHSDKAWALAR